MKDELLKVLFIDDEPLVLEGLSHLIDWDEYGFEVIGTYDIAEEALNAIESKPPDFIITDINMPEISGLELTRRLKVSHPKIVVCILSGYRDFNYAREALVLDVSNYLIKPVFDDDLIPVVEKVKEEIIKEKQQEKILDMDIADMVQGLILDNNPKYRHNIEAWLKSNPKSDVAYFCVCSKCKLNYTESLSSKDQEKTIVYVEGYGMCIYIYPIELKESLILYVKDIELDIRISIGKTVSSLKEVLSSFEEALMLQKLALDFIEERIVDKLIRQRKVHPIKGLIEGHTSRICELLKAGKEQVLIESGLQTLFRSFYYSDFNFDEIKHELAMVQGLIYEQMNHFLEKMAIDSCGMPIVSLETFETLDLCYRQLTQDCHMFIESVEKGKVLSGDHIIEDVEAYIEKNLGKSLSLKKIAAAFYMHPNYLGQKLKNHWNMCFNEYLNRRRIAKSVDLLKDKDLSVHEISVRVGYKNYASFLEYFKKYMKMTPNTYKKANT